MSLSKRKVGDRIRSLRESRRMTQQELAVAVGTSPQNIYKYEQGIVTNIPLTRLVRMADVLGVSPAELAGWEEGKPAEIVPMPAAPVEREIDPIWDSLNGDGQKQLCSYGRFLGSQEEYRAKEAPKRPVVITRIIPLLGQSFAAGSPETPGDLFMEDYSTTDTRAEFAIHVNGDSMEPYLPDGSVALGVKRRPVDGEVGAFYLDGGFLVKQVCQDSQGNIYLFSLNRDRSDADETIWHDTDRDLRTIGTILMSETIPLP